MGDGSDALRYVCGFIYAFVHASIREEMPVPQERSRSLLDVTKAMQLCGLHPVNSA